LRSGRDPNINAFLGRTSLALVEDAHDTADPRPETLKATSWAAGNHRGPASTKVKAADISIEPGQRAA